ncbi:MAG TPA: metal-sensitive transcriptional regulator [Candidatus Paceibacterota bacterium]|nr:metal-sensitive transcriptional regulator [Candidatus Paceibacterota bacterium]
MKTEAKKQVLNRLNRIEGQVRGLKKMIEEDIYCVDIITQTSAVKRALSGVEDQLLESHLGTCVIGQMKKGQEGKATKEILKVYSLKRA